MSVTISAIAGTTGLGSERQVVALANGDLWAFAYTGTLTLATWYSQDGGAVWSAGATLSLANLHLGEGRNLTVAYKRIGSVDVVHVGMIYKAVTSLGALAIRATITGSTITFHSLVTTVATPTSDADALYWSGIGLEFDSLSKLHFLAGWSGGGNGDVNSSDSTADAGSVEQMTPVTWTSHVIDSNGVAKEVRSFYAVDLGSGNAGVITGNGANPASLTKINWYTWNGSSWGINDNNGLVSNGLITAIDNNDLGAVAVSPTDIHVVYRSGSNTYVHRRYNGTSWSDGQAIPVQTSLAGGGVTLASDGASVWLTVIDTDSANTIRYIRWTSLAFNHVGDAWENWAVGEGSSATRTFVSCAKTVVNAVLLVYWTEGTNLVTAALSAPSPPDPPGTITRDAISALGSAAGVTTVAVAFTGAQPIAGDKICIGFWASFGSTPTITSVKDNATVQNTFTAGPNSILANTQGFWIYWLDLPANATWPGNYTVTVTFGTAPTESDGGAIAYGSATAGPPAFTNNNSGTSAAATTGSASSPPGNCLYFAGVTDGTGANPATFTWSAPFVGRISQTNGATQQAGSVGDVINQNGAQNAAIGVDNANWNAAIAVWAATPASTVIQQQPFPRISGLGVG